MAINILDKPYENHSGYNPIKYTVSSTNRNKLGFRYLVDIYKKGTNDNIASLKVAPIVNDDNRGTVDISRIIQNYLSSNLEFGITDNQEEATDCFFEYDIKFGESVPYEWDFNDYIFISGDGLALTTDSQYGSGFSNQPHNFTVGDQIFIKNNVNYQPNDPRLLLNGYHTVVEVIDNKTVRIDLRFSEIGSSIYAGGKVTYSDNRKQITRDMVSISNMAVNTAMSFKEFVDNGSGLKEYMPNGVESKLLTNQPETTMIVEGQHVYFNIMNSNKIDSLLFENNNGDILLKTLTYNRNIWTQNVDMRANPNLIINGSFPLIKPNTEWYTVCGFSESLREASTREYKFIIDKRCLINDIQIMFLDRKGSYNSFMFGYRKYMNGTINKESYNSYSLGKETYERGETVYHSEVEKTLSLYTNFMGEKMNKYFEELLTSRSTYIKYEDEWYACIIEDRSFEIEFERNNKHIQKNIDVRFAINNQIN